jgi:hypothetical protein
MPAHAHGRAAPGKHPAARLDLQRCRGADAMRILVFILIGLILFSLGSALFYMIRDQGKSMNTVKMLAVRVGLSIALFLILIIGYKLGFITGRLT